MTHDEYVEQASLRAFGAFEHHVVMRQGQDRWLIARPHPKGGFDSCYLAEVTVVVGGLLVHGDIDHILFMHNTEPNRVAWIGSRSRVCGYVEEKAAIGMHCEDAVRQFEADVFRAELRSELKQHSEDWGDSAFGQHVERLLEVLADDQIQIDLDRECGDHGCDEPCSRLGTVPSTRLIYAHAAVHRLHLLLSAA